jgi:hypothetical protein
LLLFVVVVCCYFCCCCLTAVTECSAQVAFLYNRDNIAETYSFSLRLAAATNPDFSVTPGPRSSYTCDLKPPPPLVRRARLPAPAATPARAHRVVLRRTPDLCSAFVRRYLAMERAVLAFLDQYNRLWHAALAQVPAPARPRRTRNGGAWWVSAWLVLRHMVECANAKRRHVLGFERDSVSTRSTCDVLPPGPARPRAASELLWHPTLRSAAHPAVRDRCPARWRTRASGKAPGPPRDLPGPPRDRAAAAAAAAAAGRRPAARRSFRRTARASRARGGAGALRCCEQSRRRARSSRAARRCRTTRTCPCSPSRFDR